MARRWGGSGWSGRTGTTHRRMNRRATAKQRRAKRHHARLFILRNCGGFGGRRSGRGFCFGHHRLRRRGDGGRLSQARHHGLELVFLGRRRRGNHALFVWPGPRSMNVARPERRRFGRRRSENLFDRSLIGHLDSLSSFGRERARQQRFAAIIAAQLLGHVFVDRAGVRDFFGDAEFVELVDDLARLHFQLPRQFIDSNLTHNKVFRLPACSHPTTTST
jgi:hypothetical protein